MAKSEINAELFNLLKSLFNFFALLYKFYQPYIKCLLLVVVAYIAFRIGRLTIVDSLDQSAGKLAEVLKNRIQYTIHLPEKIKRVDRLRKIVLWIIIVSAVIWIIVYSLKIRTFRRVKLKHILVYAALLVIAFVSTLLYELYLNFILKVGRTKDLTINQQLFSLQKQLGPRVEGLLKIFLCKESIIKHKSPPMNTCYKDNCKNYRQIFKEKVDKIQYLVNSALNFSWCFACKNKLPFNEFLEFQSQMYTSSQLPEQEQILKRNEFLFEQLARMTQWVSLLTPCNCSQIYWRESIRYIKQYKKQQKQIEKKLLLYESKLSLKR